MLLSALPASAESGSVSVTVMERHTHNKTVIWLIGQLTESLKETQLPSKQETMALFMNYKINKKQQGKTAALSTASDVMAVWEKAQIPTILKCHVVEKIKKYFNEWEKLKKNRNNKKKQSPALLQKQDEWKNNVEDLFDIAHANARDMIKIGEDH